MLPERTGRQHGTMPRDLGEPDSRHEESWEIFEESRSIRRSWADPDSELARTEAIQDTGLARHLRAGLVKREIMRESYSIGASDPLSAEMQCHWTTYRKHGEWEARTESRGTMSASRTEFRLSVTVEALEREREVERVGWDFRIPRDWV